MRFRLTTRLSILMFAFLGAGALLASCSNAPPTPTAARPDATLAAQGLGEATAATRPLSPTSTLAGTRAPTVSPTVTSTPSPTTKPTRTPIPTPTWTPTPTPEPSVLLQAAQRHQTNGDYDQAIVAYLTLLNENPTDQQAREAHYSLAESYLLNREYALAAAAWEDFLSSYPEDTRLPQATLMAARAYQEAGDCPRSIPHYQAYLSYASVLADMVDEQIGDCLAADGKLDEAATAYRQGIEATDDKGVQVGLQEKIAGTYLAQTDYNAALAEYDAILAVAQIKAYRAKIEYLAGQASAALGDVDGALARYRRAIELDPAAEYAYLSLIELVNAGVEVDEYQRGLIDYNAGAAHPDAYGAAIAAFDRYLAAGTVDKADAALYYKALAQRALEQPEAALQTLDALITLYPKSTYLPHAWLEKGAIFASLQNNDAAIKAYQDLAAFFPAHPFAPEALRRAARLRQGEGAYVEAAKLNEELQASFPGFKDADEALWYAGWNYYRAGNAKQAVANWEALLAKYPKSVYRAKTLYWLGKLDTRSESQGGGGYWTQLVAADPRAYYALRVQQIQAGDSLTVTRLITAPVEAPDWDAAQVEAVMLDWLRGWTPVPTDTVRLTLPITVTRRLDFQRGEALLAAGFRREALGAFDGVRAAAWQDPLMLAQLSLFFHERGLHGLAARTASRLAALAPKRTIYEAPIEMQRLAYPLAYADLLSAEAQERRLDPLLLAALIRQESLFEPEAESYAGARGLGQVMPATGEGIAHSLGIEDFVLDDLYRPAVSVRFGAYYLGVQMGRFDDQILVALAAYNGGPGNTLRWLEGTGSDLDLFVEAITATQSRVYLQRVYEQYLVYERLYRSAGSTIR